MNASVQTTNPNITDTSSFNELFDIGDNLVFTNAEPGTKLWDEQDSLASSIVKA
jgi:hypothetical protein